MPDERERLEAAPFGPVNRWGMVPRDKIANTVVEGPFAVLAARIRREGKPYPGGRFLRETAHKANIICEICGSLPVDLHGWTSDWTTIAQEARHHADTTGHTVVANLWNGAIYGPKEGDRA